MSDCHLIMGHTIHSICQLICNFLVSHWHNLYISRLIRAKFSDTVRNPTPFFLVCFIIGYPDLALPFFRPFPHFIHTISDHHDMPYHNKIIIVF